MEEEELDALVAFGTHAGSSSWLLSPGVPRAQVQRPPLAAAADGGHDELQPSGDRRYHSASRPAGRAAPSAASSQGKGKEKILFIGQKNKRLNAYPYD